MEPSSILDGVQTMKFQVLCWVMARNISSLQQWHSGMCWPKYLQKHMCTLTVPGIPEVPGSAALCWRAGQLCPSGFHPIWVESSLFLFRPGSLRFNILSTLVDKVVWSDGVAVLLDLDQSSTAGFSEPLWVRLSLWCRKWISQEVNFCAVRGSCVQSQYLGAFL